MLDLACQTGTHTHNERGLDDAYPTPPEAVIALLKIEPLSGVILEPCAGTGNIANTLRDAGHDVVATDLIGYDGFALDSCANFLTTTAAPHGCQWVVTNPPYRLAEQFVAHALRLVPNVAMLLRLAFLESTRRTAILERSGLRTVHIFRNWLPFMHRHGWNGPRASSAVPFARFVWSRGYVKPAVINRISWQP